MIKIKRAHLSFLDVKTRPSELLWQIGTISLLQISIRTCRIVVVPDTASSR